MIQRIYTTFISFLFAALTFTSCADWLNVYPSDEIKEDYLFSTGDGYRTAMNGIYRKMSTFNMYGSNLTWGIIDAWGQSYYMDQSPDRGGGKAMKKIAGFNFLNSELVPTTDGMWNAAWNIVANCNELAQQAATADSMLFYNKEKERKMIWAESVGLRAFVQFDLLRIYAPAPASVNYGTDSRTFIPYVDIYPSYVNNHQTVEYCLGKIIADLKEAQFALKEVENLANMGAERFSPIGSGEVLFLTFRGYRLNYYAVTAELARVYLYAGKNAEAYIEAKKLIDDEEENGYFKASTSTSNIANGNMKMYNDIIFALYSPTELVDWEHEINHSTDGSFDREYYLCIHKDIISEIYGEDKEKDFRFKYQLESMENGYYYRPLKYYKQSESSKYGRISNQTIPMIRMSEIYYIAAEAIFDKNPSEAQKYLQLVKKGRGITVDYAGVTDKTAFMKLLLNDARREFFGEGQIMYMYKRLNEPIKKSNSNRGEDLKPIDKYAVLPLPESELGIN